ncbi:MAG: SprT family zinc-dependent metalloprotease [Sediminibacterium sp.]|nr:SprT family zinc-dependent metalloprotease [Sediminibacterium sp.]
MKDTIQLGDLTIDVTRKDIKNVHLSVHPPNGRVSLSAPLNTRLEVARAYAISKLSWIRLQQEKLAKQSRETPREFVKRESHYLWGRRYLLNVIETADKPNVLIDHKQIHLYVKQGADKYKKAEILYEWQKSLLHEFIQEVIPKWEKILSVHVKTYFVQKMKTKWGSCNHKSQNIRLNTELVKKPKDLVEYVIVHEMMHLLVPTHNELFLSLMNKYYPNWREARLELNELPLSHVVWK